ncbi:Single-stranded-DNA-specific exonuclease RecJ [Phycisphaerae bacterium RAS1]|nr:Single-stranded-DNA-specific exonuclease RecJ [Phycisphaerae bacterium RAS1]
MQSAGDVAGFVKPLFNDLLAPEQLPNAVAAAAMLKQAIDRGRRIVIYGDYDVDGVTATTILWHALRIAGAAVSFYVPGRLDEGYGLNSDALDKIAAEGDALVITVDCGITAIDEAAHARKLGLSLIITDHHQPRAALPAADCIVHPTAGPQQSPNPDLCGAGVALKVAWALAREIGGATRVSPAFREFLLDATAFAAMGLVADVVPLVGENRIIASYGLKRLAQSENAGLKALIEVSGLSGKANMNDYDIGFLLAPRLNAVGRMGHARLAVELFTRATPEQAREIAQTLDGHNRQRQSVERGIAAAAEKMVAERGFDRESCRGIVLASADWHAGVIGIVASRLVERFCRPTILIALENGHGQGSGRSVRNFPLHDVLQCCGEHLLSHGGHAMAAGVKLRSDQVEPFTRAFQDQAAQRLTTADIRSRLHLDDEVALGELMPDVLDSIEMMAPFGVGNPRPRLATREVELVDPPRVVGKNANHLQFSVREGRDFRKAIAFNAGDAAEDFRQHKRVRLAFEPLINEWNGQRRAELKVIDWKFAD